MTWETARDRLTRAEAVLRRCSALKCHRDNDSRRETPDCGTCPPCAARAFLVAPPERREAGMTGADCGCCDDTGVVPIGTDKGKPCPRLSQSWHAATPIPQPAPARFLCADAFGCNQEPICADRCARIPQPAAPADCAKSKVCELPHGHNGRCRPATPGDGRERP